MYRKAKRGEALAFVQSAAEYQGDDCLEWPFGMPGDRGIVRIDGRTKTAARAVLEVVAGDPPTLSHECAHLPVVCHNLRCVNPRHLRWATPAENQADRLADGTHGGGRNSPLTVDDVLAIRADDRPHVEIERDYPVTASTISRIKNRETWRHI